MGTQKLPVEDLVFGTEIFINQFVIPAGAGATYAMANNIATITFNAAHGLTLSPSNTFAPNYFITFGGTTSGLTGSGILVGNIFRILTIPSTTAITIYSTITAAAVTSMTGIAVFAAPFAAGAGSAFVGGPSQVIATAGSYPPAAVSGCVVNARMGANCSLSWNVDGTSVFLDGQTTPNLPGGVTPSVAPVYAGLITASNFGQCWMVGASTLVFASGTTATSAVQVVS